MGDYVASLEDLRKFASLPEREKKVTPALRGILAESANTGIIRYPWLLLKPLVLHSLNAVLQDFDASSRVEIGPPRPLANHESLPDLQRRLQEYLNTFTEAPFTFQRLCELLVEPQKQYAHLHKVALAFERLLLVVKTQPMTQQPASRPRLAELKPVNENITVNYAARSSDAQQRVPLEPLFHINTDAVAAAQPTSIDEASENHSGNTEAHMPAAKDEKHANAVPATRSTDAGSVEAAIATDSPASGPEASTMGQSDAGLLNRMQTMGDANVPKDEDHLMKVDAS